MILHHPASPLSLTLPTSSPTSLSSRTKKVSVEPPPSSRQRWSRASSRASNEGSRRFHNNGEGPY